MTARIPSASVVKVERGRKAPCIPTMHGAAFDLLEPRASMITLGDIAIGLVRGNVAHGRTEMPYTFAQRSVLLGDMVSADARPYALLTHVAVAYFGFGDGPVADAINLAAGRPIWTGLAESVERATLRRFGLAWPPPPAIRADIRRADMVLRATEARDVIPASSAISTVAPLSTRIRLWPWPKAHDAFLSRARANLPDAGR